MNAETLVLMYVQEARTQSGMIKVVSMTRRMDIPSIPITYWMLSDFIQLTCSTNWKLLVLLSKAMTRGMERIAVSVVIPSAQYLAKYSFLTKSSSIAPARGRKISVLRMYGYSGLVISS
jgi:hypothetical protein